MNIILAKISHPKVTPQRSTLCRSAVWSESCKMRHPSFSKLWNKQLDYLQVVMTMLSTLLSHNIFLFSFTGSYLLRHWSVLLIINVISDEVHIKQTKSKSYRNNQPWNLSTLLSLLCFFMCSNVDAMYKERQLWVSQDKLCQKEVVAIHSKSMWVCLPEVDKDPM